MSRIFTKRLKLRFVGVRAEYRQDIQSTLEACLHKHFGWIVRQQNMSME